jgi:hypothetical protein
MDDNLRERLIIGLEMLHDQFQRKEALAWLVLCYHEEAERELGLSECIVGTYGPYATPEEALVEVGKHDNHSDEGFKNVIIPLYPPVRWKDEK